MTARVVLAGSQISDEDFRRVVAGLVEQWRDDVLVDLTEDKAEVAA